MLDIHKSGNTVRVEMRLNRSFDLHFNNSGKPIAIRISTPTAIVVHKLKNSRTPPGWAEDAEIIEHPLIDFLLKLRHGVRWSMNGD